MTSCQPKIETLLPFRKYPERPSCVPLWHADSDALNSEPLPTSFQLMLSRGISVPKKCMEFPSSQHLTLIP